MQGQDDEHGAARTSHKEHCRHGLKLQCSRAYLIDVRTAAKQTQVMAEYVGLVGVNPSYADGSSSRDDSPLKLNVSCKEI